ncbi:MAG: hypothetical protein PHH37_01000 [Paludibacter sp.]|nr:hypothetical protein [Paludibacter sp.]
MFHDNDFEDYTTRHQEIKNMPLYKKASEIIELVRQICDLFPEDNKKLNIFKPDILRDAYTLQAKITGAEATGLYDIRMENATLIRMAAKNLHTHIHTLRIYKFEHAEYFRLVRQLIEEFRILFIEWVAGFDKNNYIIDRWGLFNPEGVSPFDEDQEELSTSDINKNKTFNELYSVLFDDDDEDDFDEEDEEDDF